MSSSKSLSIRNALYEKPGPKTRRVIFIGTLITSLLVAALLALIIYRFYITGQLSARNWYFFLNATTWLFLAQGFVGTIQVAFVAGVLSLVIGLILMLGRISHVRPLSILCRWITDFFRGVPSLLLIYFFFLVVPKYNIRLPAFWMLTLPVAFSAAGVLAEVFRSGVNAVPRGQREAARALGLTRWQTLRRIVLPQAIRYVIPTMISQLVVVVKDTTVAYVVSYPDLMQNARIIITNYDALVSVYFVIALVYILLNYLIHHFSLYVAHRLGVKILK